MCTFLYVHAMMWAHNSRVVTGKKETPYNTSVFPLCGEQSGNKSIHFIIYVL